MFFLSFSLLASQFLGLNYYISSELPNPPKKHRNICKLHAKKNHLVGGFNPTRKKQKNMSNYHSCPHKLGQNKQIFEPTTRWAPTSYKWGCNNPYKGMTNGVTAVFVPLLQKKGAPRNLCHPQTFPPSEPHSHPFNNQVSLNKALLKPYC